MKSPRAIWRMLVLPLYIVFSGALFAFALGRTSGSVIGGLAPLAPWALTGATTLALLLVAGSLLRSRRRLASMRRGARVRHQRASDRTDAPADAWLDDDARQTCLESGRS